jgi:hypothetical protein
VVLRNFKYMPVKSSISIPSMLIIIHYAQPNLECKKTYEITIRTVVGLKKVRCLSVFETLIYVSFLRIVLCLLWEQHCRHSDLLRSGRFGDRIPVGTRYSSPVQNGPVAHPASYTVGTGSFTGVKRLGSGVDHSPHPTPRLKKE